MREGILKGVHGLHGGYSLARDHKRITAEEFCTQPETTMTASCRCRAGAG